MTLEPEAGAQCVSSARWDLCGGSQSRQLRLWDSYRDALNLPRITLAIIMHPMIKTFRDLGTEDVFDGTDSRVARKCCPRPLLAIARRKLDQLNRVREVHELRVPPGNRLGRLRGRRRGRYSIRINQQFRICFKWEDGDAYEVEIADYH